MKEYIFHIHGMHCTSCVAMTETTLVEHPSVSSAKSSLRTRTVEVCGDFGTKELADIANELTHMISEHGYTLSLTPEKKPIAWYEFAIAVPAALAFLFVFILLQKLGIINVVNTGNVNFGTAFAIGIIASLSTCIVTVGGLLLSISAAYAKTSGAVRPHMLFHLSRLVSFFILGGFIGLIGTAFTLNATATFILGLIIGLVMLMLGINLLDVFQATKSLTITLPAFFSPKNLISDEKSPILIPILAGAVTFFLPCGFTQSMQIFTLTTKSYLTGGLTMLFFALGTLPVLALISFGTHAIHDSKHKGALLKTAGLIVILFALYTLLSSLAAVGILPQFIRL